MSDIFDYTPSLIEITYNIKWTLLKHAQYIVSQKELFDENDFPGGFNGSFPDEHIFDAIVDFYPRLPVLAIEFRGNRDADSEITVSDMLFTLEYRGLLPDIEQNIHGIASTTRKLCRLHDTLIVSIAELSLSNQLLAYDFTRTDSEPVKTGIGFSAILGDTTFTQTEISSRMNGFDLSYLVRLQRG